MSAPFGQPYRVHDRRPVRLDVKVRFPASARAYDGRVLDVGLGGACVEITRFLGDVRIGEKASLSFQAPQLWDPLDVTARVVWMRAGEGSSDPMRFGVCFEHRTAEATLALFELIGTLVFD